jgi:hypothetical protein
VTNNVHIHYFLKIYTFYIAKYLLPFYRILLLPFSDKSTLFSNRLENGENKFFRNIVNYLPMYMASYPITLEFSVSLLSCQISNAFGSYFPCVTVLDENSNTNHVVDYYSSKGSKPNRFWNHVSANYAARELPTE